MCCRADRADALVLTGSTWVGGRAAPQGSAPSTLVRSTQTFPSLWVPEQMPEAGWVEYAVRLWSGFRLLIVDLILRADGLLRNQ